MHIIPRSHSERLDKWSLSARIPLHPSQAENAWISPRFPTLRFKAPGWISFTLHTSPRTISTGPMLAWTLFDAKHLRVLQYVETPLASQFGVVPPLARPLTRTGSMTPHLREQLFEASTRFFEGADPLPHDATLLLELQVWMFPDLFAVVSQIAAPDFFSWLDTVPVQ